MYRLKHWIVIMDWYVIGEKTYLSYGKPFLCVLLIMITINQSMNSFLYQNIIVQDWIGPMSIYPIISIQIVWNLVNKLIYIPNMYVNFYFDISYGLSFLRLFEFYRKVHIQKGILVLYKVPVTIKNCFFYLIHLVRNKKLNLYHSCV